ncbi:MAG TPA: type II toxin-antitoxin system RelE/ParE family toxin [Candidatus Babeliales bacterium]|jgi:mRNA-degrading endonuclease RelE of RelBE toxin-antitoxin system|nr:type II toxin-antitoxin system RelE/ParE family toxin [Candidatus Babeliales bacterium]
MTISGNNPYAIVYLKVVATEDVPKLPKSIKISIERAIKERLMLDPIGFGKPLRYSLKGHRRLRVGDYRIVYRIELAKNQVLIIAIKHRKDIYE